MTLCDVSESAKPARPSHAAAPTHKQYLTAPLSVEQTRKPTHPPLSQKQKNTSLIHHVVYEHPGTDVSHRWSQVTETQTKLRKTSGLNESPLAHHISSLASVSAGDSGARPSRTRVGTPLWIYHHDNGIQRKMLVTRSP